MIRVLFVDDEPQVLRGIERLLRRKEPDWTCDFAVSGAKGLEMIRQREDEGEVHDVVVADMRMPEMDGPTFLTEVRKRHPEMIRIVLSGASDLEANLRVIPIAHQFLKKPPDMARLHEAVVRSCDLRDVLKDEKLQRIVGEIDALPVQPGVYAELTEALANPRTSMASVASMVEQDAGMSAKVLQMVNSAFFGTSRSMTSIQQAVTFLGLPKIRQLMLVLEVFEAFEEPKDKKLRYFSLDYEQRHALDTARLARELVDPSEADHAFTAGVLHVIGKLVLASKLTERFAECFHKALIDDRPLEEVEAEFLGVTHAEVGAYLLALWGLPDPVVEAVAFHLEPERVQHQSFDVVSAVHVASVLAEPRPAKPIYRRRLNQPYLEGLGVLDRVDDWKLLARDLRKREAEGDESA